MMSTKRYILILLAVAMNTVALAQNYGTRISPGNGFTERLKAASQNTETIACDFEQVKYLSVLSSANRSSGKFFFKKSQDICLEYDNPKGNLIVMNGAKFKMVANGKTTVVGVKSNPMMRQLGGMLTACMTGNISLFGKESKTEYYESASCYTVVISPTNNRVKRHLQQIVLQFDKKNMTLNMMRMNESSTDYTMYEFKNKKINTSISTSKFKI